MATNRYSTDEYSDLAEVRFINRYAVFMGYLMMGVRGLGVLIVTWTTVVLLGGFVSVLGKMDFWCLTGITFVQTAGVFNFLLKEKLNDVVRSLKGFVFVVLATIVLVFNKGGHTRILPSVLLVVFSSVQLLVLVILLCPVLVIYVLGLYLSAGVSLWRLIKHDFGNADGGANLKPALMVLYALAVAQGALFGYKTLHALGTSIWLPKYAGTKSRLMVKKVVSDYVEETIVGCEKDPSFATGRNLVTYAAGLMTDSNSYEGYIAGLRVLVRDSERSLFLVKQLVTRSTSSGRMIQGLLEALGPRSPFNGEIRGHAGSIVELCASGICLERFPGAVHCISSLLLLDDFEAHWTTRHKDLPKEYAQHGMLEDYDKIIKDLPKEYERYWLLEDYEKFIITADESRKKKKDSRSQETDSNPPPDGYEGLVIQGLRILDKLAAQEDNLRVISNTPGLRSKIILAPLALHKLHRDDHSTWKDFAGKSWKFTNRLIAAPEEIRADLRRDISSNRKAITSTRLESILECDICDMSLKRQVVEILLCLSVNTFFLEASSSRIQFKEALKQIVSAQDGIQDTSGYCYMYWMIRSEITRLAGEKLSALPEMYREIHGSRSAREVSAPDFDLEQGIRSSSAKW